MGGGGVGTTLLRPQAPAPKGSGEEHRALWRQGAEEWWGARLTSSCGFLALVPGVGVGGRGLEHWGSRGMRRTGLGRSALGCQGHGEMNCPGEGTEGNSKTRGGTDAQGGEDRTEGHQGRQP